MKLTKRPPLRRGGRARSPPRAVTTTRIDDTTASRPRRPPRRTHPSDRRGRDDGRTGGRPMPPATDAPDGPSARPVTSRSILLPKCTGIAVFDQANEGAKEAAAELGVAEAEFVGPTSCTDSTRPDRVRDQRRDPGRRRDHDVEQRRRPDRAGRRRPRPTPASPSSAGTRRSRRATGESLFVAQVDFDETGTGDGRHGRGDPRRRGRRVRDPVGVARRRQPERLDRVARRGARPSPSTRPSSSSTPCTATTTPRSRTTRRSALVDAHPDLKLIMAPTTVGIAAAAKAMQDEGLCEHGQGLRPRPARRDARRTPRAAAPRSSRCGASSTSATSRTTPPTASATGEFAAEEGATFKAGRMGDVHDREGPDPRRRAADRDGTVHRLRRVQRGLTTFTLETWNRHVAGSTSRVGNRDDRSRTTSPVSGSACRCGRTGSTNTAPTTLRCGRRCSTHFGAAAGRTTRCSSTTTARCSATSRPPAPCLTRVAAMQNEPVNERWQALMGPYFVTGDAPADQQMRELDEVFHLA